MNLKLIKMKWKLVLLIMHSLRDFSTGDIQAIPHCYNDIYGGDFATTAQNCLIFAIKLWYGNYYYHSAKYTRETRSALWFFPRRAVFVHNLNKDIASLRTCNCAVFTLVYFIVCDIYWCNFRNRNIQTSINKLHINYCTYMILYPELSGWFQNLIPFNVTPLYHQQKEKYLYWNITLI